MMERHLALNKDQELNAMMMQLSLYGEVIALHLQITESLLQLNDVEWKGKKKFYLHQMLDGFAKVKYNSQMLSEWMDERLTKIAGGEFTNVELFDRFHYLKSWFAENGVRLLNISCHDSGQMDAIAEFIKQKEKECPKIVSENIISKFIQKK